jgi:hypothetical protein
MKSTVMFAQIVFTYLLMLIVMDLNFWVFISLVSGYTFGYFLFYSNLKINFVLVSKLVKLYDRLNDCLL